MTDVLFINPPFQYPKDKSELINTSIPLGIASLTTVLDRRDVEVKVIDADPMLLDEIGIVGEVERDVPAMVFMSVLSYTLPQSYRLIKHFKEQYPDVIVAVGGSHITADPNILQNLPADFGFRGEAEESLPKLIDFLLKGRGSVGDVAGLCWWKDNNGRGNVKGLCKERGGGQLHIDEAQVIENLDSLPIPARDFFSKGHYTFHTFSISRGCPFQCIYCQLAGSKFRLRSVGNVVEEVESLEKNKKEFGFVDDVFTLDKAWVASFCQEMVERFPTLRWSCTTRPDLLDEDLVEHMKQAGCYHVSMGIESGSGEVRERIGKHISNKVIQKAFKICHQANLTTRAYGMVGHPGEKGGELEQMVALFKEINPNQVLFHLTDVMPGTRLEKIVQEEGLISEGVWSEYMLGSRAYPTYVPKGSTLKEQIRKLQELNFQFHATPTKMIQKLTYIKNSRDLADFSQLILYRLIGNR